MKHTFGAALRYSIAETWREWSTAIIALLIIMAVAVGGVLTLNAVNAATQDNFTGRCLRDHPDAHVDVQVVYTGRTYYCLGPNGELWGVQ